MDLLIVEDDPGSRTALAEVLAEEGHTVRTAPNGSEAIALVANRSPAVLLLDYCLPDMNGLELVRSLRGDGVATPFILISGTAEMQIDALGNVDITDHREAARSVGAVAHLTKPVDLEELLGLLESLSG